MKTVSFHATIIGSVLSLLIVAAIGAAAWAPAQPVGNRTESLEYAVITRSAGSGVWKFSSPAETFGPYPDADMLKALGRGKVGTNTAESVQILNAVADRGWQLATHDRSFEGGSAVETWWLRRIKN